ncbi:phage major capsid protein [Catenuloplanes atrovinosus]|uniref:HK97 family phage major capsid protein n=1 Tax=Catenuloplanes atrovinosus TaxID=137266 RepID=A0AAE3YS78_9ACTN|nr:phage major capsid protein [Catenuloplanes atrovinosus]MDR7278929.1 HK97 family phage major capsid protein [Catenuloplanes atrovinosus]
MPTLQDLREQRANIWSQMTEIMDRTGNAPSGEDAAAYDRAEKELDQIGAQIERGERHEAQARSLNRVDRTGVVPAGGDESEDGEGDVERYTNVFRAFLRDGLDEMPREDRQFMRSRFVANPKNAAGVGTGSAGGYAVPPAFRDIFIETMKMYGPMLNEAEIIETATGANLPWPTNDDTGNVGALLAENTQVTEQDVTLGTASLDAYMYTSKLVRVSLQLLQDRPDFDTWLARKLGERIGRILNAHFTTGTGTSQPDGIVTSATVGVTGTGSFATTGGIAGDNLIDLVEALDPAYGASNNLKFMGNQSVRKAVRKLKDGQGRYMWEISLQNGVPDSLLGYPFLVNNDMAALAASSKSLLFGDIREAYVARIVRELTTMRLAERYADYLQVGFLAFERADGTMQNANAVRVFQTTATA